MANSQPEEAISSKLSLVCFVIPMAAFALAVVNGQNAGLLGMMACFFIAIYAAGLLFFKPPLQKKHAAWSFLISYFLSLLFFAIIAYVNLQGQQSPWLN